MPRPAGNGGWGEHSWGRQVRRNAEAVAVGFQLTKHECFAIAAAAGQALQGGSASGPFNPSLRFPPAPCQARARPAWPAQARPTPPCQPMASPWSAQGQPKVSPCLAWTAQRPLRPAPGPQRGRPPGRSCADSLAAPDLPPRIRQLQCSPPPALPPPPTRRRFVRPTQNSGGWIPGQLPGPRDIGPPLRSGRSPVKIPSDRPFPVDGIPPGRSPYRRSASPSPP